MVVMKLYTTAAVAIVLLVLTAPQIAETQTTEAAEVLASSKFRIAAAPNYEGAWWIYNVLNDKIIGYAKWDIVNRRYTLFDLKGGYGGFMQATVGDPRYQHYQQFLWYDPDNRYKGVFHLTLGGRPATPDENPYGELGGVMLPYAIGNIPPPLPEYKPFTSPLEKYGFE